MQVQTKPTPLRLLRKRYGLSQEQLARRANITSGTYYRAERGEGNVSYSTAMAILKALNEVSDEQLTLDDLGLSIV